MSRSISLHVNGEPRTVAAGLDRTLLSVLRDELDLTGTKYGCGEGQCGACIVLLDGEPVPACITPVAAAAGRQIVTIEGLAQSEGGGDLHPLQRAFIDCAAMQCGYCTPGMLMRGAAVLRQCPQPTQQQIAELMQNNICRCGTYPRITRAIQRAATMQPAHAPHPTAPSPIVGGRGAEPVAAGQAGAPSSAAPKEGAGQGVRALPPSAIGAWLQVNLDNTLTVFTGKVEVGQGIRTSLAQAVADELRLPLEAVRLIMADTERTPFDRGTFGSRTTPGMAPQLRRAAAALRELLLDWAAERWEATRADLVIAGGSVTHPETGQSLTFAELAGGRPLTEQIPEDAPTTPAARWTVAGTSAPKVNARDLVTGAHRFASDVRRPGMLYGKVLRPPALGAALVALETQAARALPGVLVVHEGDFAAVAAPDPSTAERALAALRPAWSAPPPQPSSRTLFEYLRTHPAESETRQRYSGGVQHASGSIQQGLAEADHTLRQTYTAAYIAHAPLEPRAAVAEWEGETLTVWTGTQRPFGVRAQLAEAFGIPEERVRVIVPDTGSGYGGKHYGDAAIEAARLARAAGRPVKVVWTREEEFTWAYFRPAALIEITSGVRADGTLLAWEYHNYNAGAAAIRTPYDVPHQHIEFHVTRTPLRQGSYRALAATANHFARESHMDELAQVAGMDPLAFRLKNLRDPRLRAVLEAAAESFGWQRRPRSDGVTGFGLAAGSEKGSYVATCAEVRVDATTGEVRVVRVVEAFECGAIVNPDNVRNQIEGAIVQGLGGALWEAIEFEDGRILNPRFSQYRVPRFGDVPQIETVLLDRKDLPSVGAGETPIVGIAPAVANAIYDATGLRLRSMPLQPALRASGE